MEQRTILRYEETFDGLSLWLMYKDSKGRIFCAKHVELEFEEIKDYPLLPDSTLTFEPGFGDQFLKGMANELTKIGFMADIAEQNKAELAAVESHLQDMRALVFKHNPFK